MKFKYTEVEAKIDRKKTALLKEIENYIKDALSREPKKLINLDGTYTYCYIYDSDFVLTENYAKGIRLNEENEIEIVYDEIILGFTSHFSDDELMEEFNDEDGNKEHLNSDYVLYEPTLFSIFYALCGCNGDK